VLNSTKMVKEAFKRIGFKANEVNVNTPTNKYGEYKAPDIHFRAYDRSKEEIEKND
jgi:hypothetical protein